MIANVLAPKFLALYTFIASALFIHFRGRVRHRFTRQLTDHSTFLAPYNALMYMFSSVPSKPFLDVKDFPELKGLSDNWETIRDEGMRLLDDGYIRAAAKYNDLGFNSFFRTGWKRFYLKWYDKALPSAEALCPKTVELVKALPHVHAAIFAILPPGGRLVTTWPASLDQLPPMMDYNLRHGRTYMYFKGKPLYPFGYGLSYTTFEYSNLRASSSQVVANGEVRITVDVRNRGSRAGDEVVQMYVAHIGSKVERAQEELKGFQRISLAPGQKTTVKFILKAADLAYWNTDRAGWDIEANQVDVRIGSSSADIKLKTAVRVRPRGE